MGASLFFAESQYVYVVAAEEKEGKFKNKRNSRDFVLRGPQVFLMILGELNQLSIQPYTNPLPHQASDVYDAMSWQEEAKDFGL